MGKSLYNTRAERILSNLPPKKHTKYKKERTGDVYVPKIVRKITCPARSPAGETKSKLLTAIGVTIGGAAETLPHGKTLLL